MTSNAYSELLEATIRHLQELKSCGAHYVQVDQDTLTALARTPVARAPGSSYAAGSERATVSPAQPAVVPFASPARASVLDVHDNRDRAPDSNPNGSASSKESAMTALRHRVLGCTKCPHLVAARKNVVFGVGNLNAALMFVGEAPGADEDRKGEPFVGAAGQLLNKIITAMALRREDVFIANILKCRPDTPGQTSGNRKPTPEEMATCVSYLQEQIRIIQPKVLVGLGATAIEGLLGNLGGITRLRGKWQVYAGIPLMPTYHPAYLLHNQSNTEKRKVWEDMMQVMERLGLPITEKQRGYFL